jgi:hypothetical protein
LLDLFDDDACIYSRSFRKKNQRKKKKLHLAWDHVQTAANLLMFGDQISGASFPVALFRSRTLARFLRVLALT